MKNFKFKKLFISVIIAVIVIIIVFIGFRIFNTVTNKNTNPPANNSSSNDSNDSGSNLSYYSKLYGTWSITSHIPSKIKTTLSESIINFCIGQKFTIEKDKISSIYATIENPIIDEKVMTSSEFYNTYKDTFENIGISGDKVEYIHITQPDDSDHSVTLFISEDGKVYALLKGALFELKAQSKK